MAPKRAMAPKRPPSDPVAPWPAKKHMGRSPSGDRVSSQVMILGAGPAGLAAAICIAEHAKMLGFTDSQLSVTIYELRLRNGEGGKFAWNSFNEGPKKTENRRREQVVTLQRDVLSLFDSLGLEMNAAFAGPPVWPHSQNVALRDVEDSLLARAQGLEGFLTVRKLPPEVEEAVRKHKLTVIKDWLATCKYDILVGADGANSVVRSLYVKPAGAHVEVGSATSEECGPTCFGPIEHLANGTGLGEDYALGIGFEYDESWSPHADALNVFITLSQTRYLFNSAHGGRRGYVNLRLTKQEYETLTKAAGAPCKFAAPCVLHDCFKPKPDTATPIYELEDSLRKTIHEGLELFGIPPKLLTTIVACQLDPCYATNFYAVSGGKDILLIGDAAMSHHYWPGRGLNTGLKSAVALARAIVGSLSSRSAGPFKLFDEFMQELRQQEMQGRSASMMACNRPPSLPEHIDDSSAPSRRQARLGLATLAHECAEQEASKMIERVTSWRDQMEKRANWPHPPCSDEDISSRFSGYKRPSGYVLKVMNDSAAGWGWPAGAQDGGVKDVMPDVWLPDLLAECPEAQERKARVQQLAQATQERHEQDIKSRQLKRNLSDSTDHWHRTHCAEEALAQKHEQNPLAFYDLVVEMPRFSDLWKKHCGWPIHMKPEWEGEACDNKRPAVMVVVIGNFKKGKTWLLSRLTGADFPSSSVVPTPGLCARMSVVNHKVLYLLDVKGENTPLETIGHDALSEKKAEEAVVRDIICDIADAFIYVVNSIGYSEQLTLWQLTQELSDRGGKGLHVIIVVHNLRDKLTNEHMTKSVAEIQKVYKTLGLQSIEEDIKMGSRTMTVTYLEGNRIRCSTSSSGSRDTSGKGFQTRHFFLGAHGSEAGYLNDFVIEKIRRMLLDVTPMKTDDNVMGQITKAANKVMPKYVKGQERVQVQLQRGEHGCYLAAAVAETDDIQLRSLDLGTFVNVRTASGEVTPRYVVSESDEQVLLRVELPGFTLAELKSLLKDSQAIAVRKEMDGVAIDFKMKRPMLTDDRERKIDGSITSNEIDTTIRIDQMLQDFNPTGMDFCDGVLTLKWNKVDKTPKALADLLQ